MIIFLVGTLAGLAYGLSALGGSLVLVPLLMLAIGMPITNAAPMSLCMLIVMATITAGDGVRARLPVPGLIWPFALVTALLSPVGVAVTTVLATQTWAALYIAGLGITAFALWQMSQRLPEAVMQPRARLASLKAAKPEQMDVVRPSLRRVLLGGGLGGIFTGLFAASGAALLLPALAGLLPQRRGQAMACVEMAVLPGLFTAVLATLLLGYTLDWRATGLMIFGALAGLSVARMVVGWASPRFWHGLVALALLALAAASLLQAGQF